MKFLNDFKIWFSILILAFSIPALAQSSTSDAVITSSIKSEIMLYKPIAAFNVSVTTNNGIVYLSGIVDSDSQAEQIIEIAQSTSGVSDVDASHLKVKNSRQPFTDLIITSKVKGLFIREKLFGNKEVSAMSIHVETNNGVVYLTGHADTQTQADNAARIAKSVSGVKKVESTVEVG